MRSLPLRRGRPPAARFAAGTAALGSSTMVVFGGLTAQGATCDVHTLTLKVPQRRLPGVTLVPTLTWEQLSFATAADTAAAAASPAAAAAAAAPSTAAAAPSTAAAAAADGAPPSQPTSGPAVAAAAGGGVPMARAYHACATIGGRIFVHGGQTQEGDAPALPETDEWPLARVNIFTRFIYVIVTRFMNECNCRTHYGTTQGTPAPLLLRTP